MKTEYSTSGGSLILEGSRTLKNSSFESISTKKRFFILYLGKFVCYFAAINVPCSVLWKGVVKEAGRYENVYI